MNEALEEFLRQIDQSENLHVQQVLEGLELVLNWESRNKYRILDHHKQPVAFAAEGSKGIFGALARQFLGHWRSFDIILFNQRKEELLRFHFPFRWFFKTLLVRDRQGQELGRLQQRFAFFRKRFDLLDPSGALIAEVDSGFFKFWTFEFEGPAGKLGAVKKKWSGAFSEIFTDRDNFIVEFARSGVNAQTRLLMLASCLMFDIVYFQKKK